MAIAEEVKGNFRAVISLFFRHFMTTNWSQEDVLACPLKQQIQSDCLIVPLLFYD